MKKDRSLIIALLSLSFLEGAAILCLQLAAGSILSPFFGHTLQTWATLIGVIFAGFALGYFFRTKVVFSKIFSGAAPVLLISGLYLLAVSRFISHLATAFISFPPPWGILFACIVLVLPPVVLLSTIPIYVSQKLALALDKHKSDTRAGISNGLSFFISTMGAITAAFVTGFFLIPAFGPQQVLIFTGLVLFALALPVLFMRWGLPGKILCGALAIVCAVLIFIKPEPFHLNDQKIIYSSHGVLGQLIITDDTLAKKRNMYLDGSLQSQVSYADHVSAYGYVKDMIAHTDSIKTNSSVLLLGLGGGYLARHFGEKGCQVDIVELDERIWKAASNYFMDSALTAIVHIDDARHYINSVKDKKYDVIVVDVYTGDNAPFHIVTREAFIKMRSLLREKGILCVYFPYSLDDKILKAHGMLKSTLYAAGFEVEENPVFGGKTTLYARPVNVFVSSTENDLIFTDNHPQLEVLMAHQGQVLNTLRKKLWQKK